MELTTRALQDLDNDQLWEVLEAVQFNMARTGGCTLTKLAPGQSGSLGEVGETDLENGEMAL